MSRVFSPSRLLMAAAQAASRSRAKAAAAVPSTSKASDRSAKVPAALRKAVPVSPAMREFLGVPEISRTDVLKKIWEYIKQHELQNPANKKEILCDEKLKTIFDGKDKVGMLEIAKLINAHFTKTS